MAKLANSFFARPLLWIAVGLILTGATCTARPQKDPCGPQVEDPGLEVIQTTLKFVGMTDAVKVTLPVAHPAEIDLTRFKTVAFTDIEGNYGEAFSTALRQKIVEDGGLKVIDRNELQRLLKEQGLSQSDLFDSENRVTLGKLLPAAVIVSGNINTSYKEKTGSGMGNCPDPSDPLNIKKRIPCPTFTLKGFANIEGNVKFINVETGADIQVKHLEASAEKTHSETGKQPEPINEKALHEINLKEVIEKTAHSILPWREDRKVVFFNDESLPQLWEGINEAKAGELHEAKKLFAEAISVGEENSEISPKTLTYAHWNKGLTNMYTGEFKEAIEEFKTVERLEPGEYETAWMRKVIKCLEADEKKRRDHNT